jgi:type I restriction enzyme S subunit
MSEQWESKTFIDAIGADALFCDGDWIESKDQDPNGEVRLVQLADILDGEFKQKSERFMTRAKSNELRTTLLEKGDLLIARMPDPIGRACIFPGSEQDCVTVVDVAIARPTNCDPEWLMHCLNSQSLRTAIEERATGSTRKRISRSALSEMTLPVPPLPEQKKIAEILSGIDTQRQALAKKVANASMLLNALGEKIFSSLDGETVPLGELCNPKQWQTISTNQLTTSGYPVYGANGKIGYFTEYNHKEPVLAVTCRGATCGNLTLVPAFSYVTGNSMCLDNPRENTSPEYLFQFLAWRGLKDVISGSAQPQITRSPLQAVEVVLPSKEKQRKIVTALESVNNVKNMVNIALSRHDLLKQAIASDLLSGRKRVSV